MNPTPIGRFWAVGVGPGAPDLVTLRAVEVLRRAHVIYHAGPEPDHGRALTIVRSLLKPEQAVRQVLTAAMGNVQTDHYRPGVEQIAQDCLHGRNVALIAEGDPTLYSTAAHVWQLLAELYPDIAIEVVPGVSSITAAAARTRWPLAQKGEPLLIVPAGYHATNLHTWINTFPSICLLKPGQVMPEVVRTLNELGPRREAIYLEELGTPQEWLTRDLASAAERRHYFALVLIRSTKEKLAGAIGELAIVGLGPGNPALLTAQARQALQQAEVIIGYAGYLKTLAPLGFSAEFQGFPIGAEAERAQKALELARSGRRVALVSSGDAGIYGMASLLLETGATMPEVAINVIPGVTAASAAASLLGAPLGHDFACISLSDLLTPWNIIEKRLSAVADADFALAVYNPISQRRTWQLLRARDILLTQRQPDTPVGLVDRAHRPGMRVWHTTLAALTTDGIGMETLVIIGNRQTRIVNGRMVTPRGYGASGVASAPRGRNTRR